MQEAAFLYIKSECLYKETQNLLKISDKTDGNFVQLHKHTQETEQCICLKKALQTSQGAPARAPALYPCHHCLFRPFRPFGPLKFIFAILKFRRTRRAVSLHLRFNRTSCD